MEEDIKILEEIDITDFYNNYSVYTFPEEEIKRKCQALKNLLTRYKELEEENARLELLIQVKEDMIKAKIEELKKRGVKLIAEQKYFNSNELLAQIQVLQELLGDDE